MQTNHTWSLLTNMTQSATHFTNWEEWLLAGKAVFEIPAGQNAGAGANQGHLLQQKLEAITKKLVDCGLFDRLQKW